MCFDEGNVRSWDKKVSTFKIFRSCGLISCVSMKKNFRSLNKKFSTFKIFRCCGLILCVLEIKEMSDAGMKKFPPSNFQPAAGSYFEFYCPRGVRIQMKITIKGRIQGGERSLHLNYYRTLLSSATTIKRLLSY